MKKIATVLLTVVLSLGVTVATTAPAEAANGVRFANGVR